MSKFAELDAAILARLADGPEAFNALSIKLEGIAAPLVVADKRGVKGPAWRVIDRRLQSLRMAGKIVHSRKTGWSLA